VESSVKRSSSGGASSLSCDKEELLKDAILDIIEISDIFFAVEYIVRAENEK